MKKLLLISAFLTSVHSTKVYAQTAFQEALQKNVQRDADKYGYKYPELMNKQKQEQAAAVEGAPPQQPVVAAPTAPVAADSQAAVKPAVVLPATASTPKRSIVGSFKNSLGGKNATENKRTPLVEMKTFDQYRKDSLDSKEAREGKVILP